MMTIMCHCNIYLIILILIVGAFGLLLLNSIRKPDTYPPGPSWLPFIGCYFQVKKLHSKKKYYHMVWSHFHQIYGSVVGLKMGRDRIVTVSGYQAVKQVLNSETFEGRPDGFFFRLRSFGERLGVVFVEGPFMHEQRKFCMHQLRNCGLGKDRMHHIVTNEVLEVVEFIKAKSKEGPIQVQYLFDVGTLNVLWTMIAGYRFTLDDKRLQKMLDLVHAGFRLVDMSGGLLNQMPFLRHVFPSLSGYNTLTIIVKEIMQFLQDIVSEHEKQSREDFISAFLEEVDNNKDNKHTSFRKKQLLVILEDLFMAGTETTSSTLTFALFYLVKYPEIQEKIHIELDKVVGDQQIPSMNHQLTFLEATIMEIQRHANTVPVAIPHVASEDTQLMGYEIPKGTFILPSIYSVHMDEKYWENPRQFNPQRFINKDGKIILSSHFMPYGIGRRKCLGETLARSNLFLFLSILLHKFKIEFCSDDVSGDILDGVTLALAPFKVNFIPRT